MATEEVDAGTGSRHTRGASGFWCMDVPRFWNHLGDTESPVFDCTCDCLGHASIPGAVSFRFHLDAFAEVLQKYDLPSKTSSHGGLA